MIDVYMNLPTYNSCHDTTYYYLSSGLLPGSARYGVHLPSAEYNNHGSKYG